MNKQTLITSFITMLFGVAIGYFLLSSDIVMQEGIKSLEKEAKDENVTLAQHCQNHSFSSPFQGLNSYDRCLLVDLLCLNFDLYCTFRTLGNENCLH